MSRYVLGVDPGLSGALALLDPDGRLMWVQDNAVAQPLPIRWLGPATRGRIGIVTENGAVDLTDALAHYGPPESLVGKWVVELRRA